MYSVYADGICIYSDLSITDNVKAAGPKLSLADNSAGSLTITLAPSNAGYASVKRLSSEIIVYRENVEIWSGRVIDEDEDFWKNRTLTCEGELGYLNDTTQPPAEYHEITVRAFLEALINVHNQKSSKKFTVGNVTVTDSNDSLYRYTNYETTLDCINDKLVNRLGGHLLIRKVNGVRYLDYLSEYPNTNTQTIQFGVNLLDWTRNWDLTKLATVILPRGARLDESPIEALEAYTTVESVNGGSIYVASKEAVDQYGWIEQVIDWNDVTEPANLLKKAQEYLKDAQFEMMTLEISAVDLHHLTKSTEPIKLLDEIRCVSKPHGMDHMFPVSAMEIPLDNPANTRYTLGKSVRNTLTSFNKQADDELLFKMESLPSESSILKKAIKNATDLINNATTGYITIVRNDAGAEELIISDNRDYKQATRLWKWNLNGLGYSKDGGKTFGLAMTMDGSIVADYVTTGRMSADRIRGGSLEIGGSGFGKDGSIVIKDKNDRIIGRLDINGISFGAGTTISGGAITGTTITGGSINIGNGRFIVDADGYLSWSSANSSMTRDGTLTVSSCNITGGSIDIGGSNDFVVQNDGDVKIGGFECRYAWGRDIFQSSDGQCGMSASSSGNGNLWFWAGYRSSGNYDFVVNNLGEVHTKGAIVSGAALTGTDVFVTGDSWWKGWGLTQTMLDVYDQLDALSDQSVKENIIPIDKDEALTFLLNHTPSTFQYKTDGRWSAGFIAQEVEALEDRMEIYYPLVALDKRSQKYMIRYTNYIPLLVASIQNLQGQIDDLKGGAAAP